MYFPLGHTARNNKICNENMCSDKQFTINIFNVTIKPHTHTLTSTFIVIVILSARLCRRRRSFFILLDFYSVRSTRGRTFLSFLFSFHNSSACAVRAPLCTR